MIKLSFAGSFKGTLVMEELLAAFPEWVTPDPNFPGRTIVTLTVHTTPILLILSVPINADVAAVTATVTAHDPNLPDLGEIREQERVVNKTSLVVKLLAPPLNLDQEEIDIFVV